MDRKIENAVKLATEADDSQHILPPSSEGGAWNTPAVADFMGREERIWSDAIIANFVHHVFDKVPGMTIWHYSDNMIKLQVGRGYVILTTSASYMR